MLFLCGFAAFVFFVPSETDGSFLASADAVEAVHAAGVVYDVLLSVNAGGFATSYATAAVGAFVRVDCDAENGASAQKTQESAYGAHCIAPDASSEHCAGGYHEK